MNPANLDKLGPNDVIMASYPGSGAAWLGCIFVKLGFYYLDGYHEILFDQHSQKSHVNPRLKPHRNRLPVYRDRDKLHPIFREKLRIIKTHMLADHVGNRHHGKTLLLVRDGRDSILSYYNWLKNFAGLERGLEEFLQYGTVNEPIPPAKAWAYFYENWLAATNPQQNHVVRFEDLREDPLMQIKKILCFFAAERSDYDINEAIKSCSFKAMKQSEVDEVSKNANTPGKGLIMRRGEIGEWKRVITPPLLSRVEMDAGLTLARFKYK